MVVCFINHHFWLTLCCVRLLLILAGIRNEEKQKHVLGVDNALMPKKKREALPKEERFPESDHGMIGELVLKQNDQNQKLASDECVILLL